MSGHLQRRLRPMGFSDILDEAVDLYRRNFPLLFGIGAVLYLPLSLLMSRFGLDDGSAFVRGNAAAAAGGLGALALLVGVETVVITGAMTIATAQTYLERQTGIWACYKKVIEPATLMSFICANMLFLGLVLLSSIPAIVVIIGAAAAFGGGQIPVGLILLPLSLASFVIPVYVGTRLAVYTPAFFVEGRGAVTALRRSWELLKGRAAGTFGIIFVVSAVIALIESIALSPFSIIMGRDQMAGAQTSATIVALNILLRSGLQALLAPISAMVIILIYYDSRIRREGFDLEMLAADLDRRSQLKSSSDRIPPSEEKLSGREESGHTAKEPTPQ